MAGDRSESAGGNEQHHHYLKEPKTRCPSVDRVPDNRRKREPDQHERNELGRLLIVFEQEQLDPRSHESDDEDDQQHSTKHIERLMHSGILPYGPHFARLP